MRTCLTALLLAFAAAPLLADDPEPPGDKTKDLRALQGTWKVKSLTIGKNAVAQEVAAAAKMTLTFTKDKVKVAHGDTALEHTVKIDAKKKPMHFDVTEKDGKTTRGIYKIEKGDLHVAFSAPPDEKKRPAGFADNGSVIMVLTKEKK